MKEQWPVCIMQHYTLLMLECSWLNVHVTSVLWMYFSDMLTQVG